MSTSAQLTLRVGGMVYGGWKSVSVRTGIEQIAGIFELAITERWPNQPTQWAIPPGESCAVEYGDEVLITGYVDAVAVNYDASQHEIKVTGRDRTGDLVDCSAPSLAFSNLSLMQIAEKLCKPFGVTVIDETTAAVRPGKPRAVKALPKQAVQNGETVHRALEKLARIEGVLLASDGLGGLIITRAGLAGQCDTVLEFGKNILAASFEHSHAALYSEITVKGQASAAAAAQYGVVDAQPKGVVKRSTLASTAGNSQINRYRPLIIVAETQADGRRCQNRAAWEAGNREAKARKVSVTVQGWRETADGPLWRINKRVRVVCPWMRLDEWWVIAAIDYKLDESGTTAELSLVSAGALDVLPEIPAVKSGAGDAAKYQVAKP